MKELCVKDEPFSEKFHNYIQQVGKTMKINSSGIMNCMISVHGDPESKKAFRKFTGSVPVLG